MKILRLMTCMGIFIMILISCSKSNKDNNQVGISSEWDEAAREYRMPDFGLIYRVPNLQNLIIAPPASLSGGMIMCMIDTISQECVAVVNLSSKSHKEYKELEIREFISKIVEQDSSVNHEIVVNHVYDQSFRGWKAWKFIIGMKIFQGQDTIQVSYAGYLFDRGSGMNAIVMTTGADTDKAAIKIDYQISLFEEYK